MLAVDGVQSEPLSGQNPVNEMVRRLIFEES
jgi:hypothetical protein